MAQLRGILVLASALCVLSWISSFPQAVCLAERYEEAYWLEARVSKEGRGAVLIHRFELRYEALFPKDEQDRIVLYPYDLQKIQLQHDIKTIHASITQGRWRRARWGILDHDFPSGTFLSGSFKANDNYQNSDKEWDVILNKFGGLYCPSISSTKKNSFSSRDISRNSTSHKEFLTHRFTINTEESPCVENFRKFSLFSPCGDSKGIYKNLDKKTLLTSPYLSHFVELRKSCAQEACDEIIASAKQGVVFVEEVEDHEIRISDVKLLSSILKRTEFCPAASNTTVNIKIGDSWQTFDAKQSSLQSIAGNNPLLLSTEQNSIMLPLSISRKQTLIAGLGGGINYVVKNNLNSTLWVRILEVQPWFMQPRLHSMQATKDGKVARLGEVLQDARFSPSTEDRKPGTLTLSTKIGPGEVLSLHYEFDKSFLHINYFPADSHRGYEIPPSFVRFSPFENFGASESYSSLLHTEVLVVRIPTPDFSMPYNVIALTGTVWALFLGSLINLSVRKYDSEGRKKHAVIRLLQKLRLFPHEP